MTLLGVKPSTKDIDFMVPVHAEHENLIRVLRDLGYEQETASGWKRREEVFRFDLFKGKRSTRPNCLNHRSSQAIIRC